MSFLSVVKANNVIWQHRRVSILSNMHPKSLSRWTMMPSPIFLHPPSSMNNINPTHNILSLCCASKDMNLSNQKGTSLWCAARRQVRFQDDDEYGHNEEIAQLEFYSQSARGEAILVHALVDQEEVDVLIFKVSLSSANNCFQNPEPIFIPNKKKIIHFLF